MNGNGEKEKQRKRSDIEEVFVWEKEMESGKRFLQDQNEATNNGVHDANGKTVCKQQQL